MWFVMEHGTPSLAGLCLGAENPLAPLFQRGELARRVEVKTASSECVIPLIWIDLSTVVLMVTFFCVSVYRFSKALVQDMGSDSRRWITLICVGWLPTGLHFVTELPFSLFVGHPHSGGATKGDLGFSSPATHTLNQSLCFAVFMPAPCCDVPCLSPHRQSPR